MKTSAQNARATNPMLAVAMQQNSNINGIEKTIAKQTRAKAAKASTLETEIIKATSKKTAAKEVEANPAFTEDMLDTSTEAYKVMSQDRATQQQRTAILHAFFEKHIDDIVQDGRYSTRDGFIKLFNIPPHAAVRQRGKGTALTQLSMYKVFSNALDFWRRNRSTVDPSLPALKSVNVEGAAKPAVGTIDSIKSVFTKQKQYPDFFRALHAFVIETLAESECTALVESVNKRIAELKAAKQPSIKKTTVRKNNK